jgi:hypothetical protein
MRAAMSGDPAVKQRFLEQARSLSERPKFVRYRAVAQLICDALAFGIRDEAEIFRAAYGDPSGSDYWEAYLSVAIPVFSLANVLSAHSSKNIEELENRRFATLRAFRGAAEAGESWFVGITKPILVVEEFGQAPEGLSKVRVQPRAAVEWLLSKSIFEHLVPESLHRFLQNEKHVIATAKTEKISKAPDVQLPVGNSPRERVAQPRNKSRPAFERARRVIDELYPDGIPDQATVSNKSLCTQVNEKLKKMGQQPVSQDTVERAAGRRK